MVSVFQVFSALTGLFLPIVVLLPSSAHAACASLWDVSGEWVFMQTNGFSANFNLQQNGTELHGTASYTTSDCWETATCPRATIDGSIHGDDFEVTAYWSAQSIGVYKGKLGPQGRIQGDTFDRQHPESTAKWYSNRTAKCLTSLPIEHDTDRPGSDIQYVLMGPGDVYACQAICQNDARCRAWTYVKPNPQATCWIKHSIPAPIKNSCCLSGIK